MGGLTVANVLGVPLGTLVGQQLGWRTTFWVIGAAAVLAGVAVRSVLPGESRDRSGPVGVRSELRVFRDGRLWLNLGTIAVFEAGVMGTFSYLAPVLTDVAGLAAGVVPVALTLYGIGSLVGIQLGGRLSDAHPWTTMYSALAAIVLVLATLGLAGTVASVTLVMPRVSSASAPGRPMPPFGKDTQLCMSLAARPSNHGTRRCSSMRSRSAPACG